MAHRRPNVLFIFTDQQARHAMSGCGNAHLSTAHMDRIAQRGVRFEHSYCASPVCSPARAALMTGLMPHEVGVNVLGDPFDESLATMGSVFRDAGYRTAYAGKWHLSRSFVDSGDAHGFEFLGFSRTPASTSYGVDTDPLTADAAVAFLQRKHDQPFLLAVSLHNPHDICGAISRTGIQPMSGPQAPPLPANFPRDPLEPQFITQCRQRGHYGGEQIHTRHWTLDHWRGYLHTYYRLVEMVDVQVGRVLQALREQDLEQQTLVVFTSDHGEGAAAHQWVVKLMLYEEPATVPLIWSWPGVIPQGRVDSTHLASGVDVLPTLCDFAGIDLPTKVSGVSLRPVIDNPELSGRDFIVCELQPDNREPGLMGRMIRTRVHKYVAFSHGERSELLYDLTADPGETCNLADLPEHQPVLALHRTLLRQWVRDSGDRFPISAT